MRNMNYYNLLSEGVKKWNSWRQENLELTPDLTGVNLENSDLHGIDFSNTILSFCNLKNTNLAYAKLYQTEFYEADISNANLSGTDLRGAKLHNTKMTNSSLIGADLFRVDFINTILNGVDFNNSRCDTTAFSNIDLSKTFNLDKIQHTGRSHIDVFTIYKSIGQVPISFFKGAGISEEFIISIGDFLKRNPVVYYSCFISYSHANKSFAEILYSKLQENGVSCWLDEHQIEPGQKIYSAIDKGIKNWDKILLCCSESSLNSWWVNDEISKALKKEQDLWIENGKEVLSIIPLNLDNYLFKWDSPISNQLTDRFALDFTDWQANNIKFNNQIVKLLGGLKIK